MADKRSLGDALTLTPEKLAFIQGEGASSSIASASMASGSMAPGTVAPSSMPPSADPPPRKGRKPKTVEIELATSDKPSPEHTPRIRRAEQRRDGSAKFPSANDVLDEVLIPLTTRIPHRLHQSLRRVCLERRLQHQKPDSIQEIVEEALGEWLSRRH